MLPSEVIDPVVIYYRQLAAASLFVDDLRSDRFERLDSRRKQAMLGDYVRLLRFADTLAGEAVAALSRSLSISVEDPSGRLSGAGRGEASAGSASRSTSGQASFVVDNNNGRVS